MSKRCEWCGDLKDDMQVFEMKRIDGFVDPFKARDSRYYACGTGCKTRAALYYDKYRRFAKLWLYLTTCSITAATFLYIPWGMKVLRWAMPVSVIFSAVLIMIFPVANRFTRDADGCLVKGLKTSMHEGRLMGFLLILLAVFLIWRVINLPLIV